MDLHLNTLQNDMSPQQYEIMKELCAMCSKNAFWLFMTIQGVMFDSKNKDIIQNEIYNFSKEWSNLFSRYYNTNDARIIKINIDNFFNSYLSYLNSICHTEYKLCKDLLKQWTYLANILAENFANLNPNWKQAEWNGMLNNQISILDKEMQNNMKGEYSTLTQSYDIYNKVSNDIAEYIGTGLIKQFSI